MSDTTKSMADFKLAIKADTGYACTTEGRCDAEQYGAAMAALHGRPTATEAQLLAALRAARACIMTDRTALADCHMDPATNAVDALGQDGLDEYDAVLKQIDSAIVASTGSAA